MRKISFKVRNIGSEKYLSYILNDDIVKGGNLTFVMGNTPNKEFGAAPENRPKTAE